MSLIHWWPLNGNLNDYGIKNIPLTNQGSVAYSNSGKIGKGASFTSDSQSLKATDLATLSALTQYTMTCWVYLTNTATNHSSSFLSSGDWNSTSAQVCFGLYDYSSGYNKLLVPNKTGGWNQGISLSTSIKLNTWHHYAITYDGTTTKAYIDGVYVGAYNGGGINSNSVGYYYLGAATYYSGFTMKGVLNDFRIYDSVLSIAEIREVSKGLVLHYDFEDVVNKNLLYNTKSVANAEGCNLAMTEYTYNGIKGIRLTKTTTASWHSFLRWVTNYQILDTSKKYSFSVEAVSLNGINQTINNFFANDNSNNVFISNTGNKTITSTLQRFEWTNLTPNSSFSKTTNVNNIGWHYNISSTNFDIFIANPKFEACDTCTVFTDYMTSSNDSSDSINGEKIYDSSGYGNNGIINGNLQITADSISGQHSAIFDSNIYIESPALPDFYQATYSFWVKLNGNSQAYRAVFIPKNNPTGAGIWLSLNTEGCGLWAYQGSNSPSYCKYGNLLSDNTWYLCTHVFNNGVGQWYLNGQPITGTTTYTTRSYITGGVYTIGDSYTGSSWSGTPFDGKISDFKIYATALSAADILTEYQRKAAIYRDGTLITGEFVESDSLAILPLANTYFTGAVFDTTNNVITVSGHWVGFQFANSLFTLNKCYHLSFDAQYQSGTFLNILGHSNNFAVNAYLDGKKLATSWGSAPAGALAEESVMLDGKWHHFDLYVKYQSQTDSYGPWIQVNRTDTAGSAVCWFANLAMKEIATITTMPTAYLPTKTATVQASMFNESGNKVYVSHTGLIGSGSLIEE